MNGVLVSSHTSQINFATNSIELNLGGLGSITRTVEVTFVILLFSEGSQISLAVAATARLGRLVHR